MDEIPFCITFETSFDPFKSVFGSVIATKVPSFAGNIPA